MKQEQDLEMTETDFLSHCADRKSIFYKQQVFMYTTEKGELIKKVQRHFLLSLNM